MGNPYVTAGTILNRAAVQLGLASVADPYGQQSQDPNLAMLAEFLSTAGDDLLNEHEWSHLVKDYTFVTAPPPTSLYSLPADFVAMVDQSGWNRSTFLPLAGPVSDQQWTYVKAQQAGVTLNVIFRLRDQELELLTPTPGGQTIALEYLSSSWVRDGGSTTVDAAGVPVGNKSAPTSSSDLVLFDPLLMVRAVKVHWLQARGFDTTVARREYEDTLASATTANRGSSILSLNRRPPGARLVDGDRNLPVTGYGG